jgi:hypothetical protein
MARESKAINGIINQLNTIENLKVYEHVQIDKWNTYNFNYVGILSGSDTREPETFEDDSTILNRGQLEIFILVGCQVKKIIANKATLRNALADLCEVIEYKLHNLKLEGYLTEFEATEFAPLTFVDSQAITFSDDETKGISLMTFRTIYYRN